MVPNTVTVETNQLVQFRAVRQSPRGERHELPLTWHASGGAIDDSGIFTAAEPGVYKVIGKGRGRQKPDTSIVVVVPPQPNIVAVSVSPDTTTLGLGGSYGFAAVGVLSDGTTVPVGVNWRATGGSVDAGGVYTAGTDAGHLQRDRGQHGGDPGGHGRGDHRPAAASAAGAHARAGDPSPGTLALGTGATAQLAAYGRTSLGDSVAVEVTYSATGGSIRSDGLYTAGSTAGSFRIIASAGTFADTTSVSLTAPPPPPPTADAAALRGGVLGVPHHALQRYGRDWVGSHPEYRQRAGAPADGPEVRDAGGLGAQPFQHHDDGDHQGPVQS